MYPAAWNNLWDILLCKRSQSQRLHTVWFRLYGILENIELQWWRIDPCLPGNRDVGGGSDSEGIEQGSLGVRELFHILIVVVVMWIYTCVLKFIVLHTLHTWRVDFTVWQIKKKIIIINLSPNFCTRSTNHSLSLVVRPAPSWHSGPSCEVPNKYSMVTFVSVPAGTLIALPRTHPAPPPFLCTPAPD